MARVRKKKWTGRPFESVGEHYTDSHGNSRPDVSARIFESMLVSPAFRSLTARQKVLYLYCKAQHYGKKKPSKDYDAEQYPQTQQDICFYFNLALAVEYGLYAKTSRNEFYSDIKRLREVGLIETVISGKATKTKSVYRFSSKWRDFKE